MPIIVFQHDARCSPGRLGRTLRNLGMNLDVRRLDLPLGQFGGPVGNRHVPVDFDDVQGVISLGGAMNVTDEPPPPWMASEIEFLREAHKRNLPLVGVCLGHQLIAKALGGEVGPMEARDGEQGMVVVKQHPIANTDTILAGIPWQHHEFQSHRQEVKALPPGATCLQFSDLCKVQSFRAGLRTYAFQYHFECDWGMVEEFMGVDRADNSKSPDPYMAELLVACRSHYPEFAQAAERLCVNLASYLFPASRRNVA